MENSTNYELKLYEGSDKFNPLNVDVPNFETIDEVMKANEVAGVQSATELANNSVHEITRSNPDAQVFRFVATAKWNLGDSMTVDGTPVTVLLPSGKNIPDGAYVIGANVLGVLVGTNCTLYLSETGGVAEDSEKLDGQLPSYYAKTSDLQSLNTVVNALGNVVTPLNERVDANELNGEAVTISQGTTYTALSDGYLYVSASAQSDKANVVIKSPTDVPIGYILFVGNSTQATRTCTYIKKGMKIEHSNASVGSGVVFYPLI